MLCSAHFVVCLREVKSDLTSHYIMLNIYEEFKDVLMLVDSACTLQRRFYFIDATMIILFPAFYHSFVFLPTECSYTFYHFVS